MPITNAPGVRVHVSADPRQAVAFVDDADGTQVRVRFHSTGGKAPQWRCDRCGAHVRSTCPHETAALPVVAAALRTCPGRRAPR